LAFPDRRVAAVVALALACVAAPSTASAQRAPLTTAAIEGRVLDPDGHPLAGVTIFVRRDRTDLAVRVASDASGAFRIDGLPAPGVYQLMAALGSYTEAGPRTTLTDPGSVVSMDVRLTLAVAEQLSVTANVWTLPLEPPNSIVSRTAEQLRAQNVFNPEDAIRNLPSTTSRKRYVGDRNALVGGRSFGTLQPSRALVYLDGYLLSNFLGRFDAPRWNMVTPAAVERVDVLYGPFSAVHPGNSIGTTIVMTERTPTAFEWGFRATGASQSFGHYGESDAYGAGQLSAYLGGRASSGLWGAVTFNRQDATSQPMQYFAVTANDGGTFPAASGDAVAVTGIQYDTDPRGRARALFGANAGAIDHTVQDSVKLRLGYARPAAYEVSGLMGVWRNETAMRNTTFLRDARGNPVWQGRVTDGVNQFVIPATALAPSTRDELHSQVGLTLRTRRPLGWNGSLIVSDYRILDDVNRQAGAPDPVAAGGGIGTATRRDGTGWGTFELQATRTPARSRHTATIGVHRNGYRLDHVVRNSTDWRSVETTTNQRYTGRTLVHALYAQDVVRLRHDLKLTLGWRAEWFEAWDGMQLARVGSCAAGVTAECRPNGDGTFDKAVLYPRRTLSGQSPKASVTWTATDALLIRASVGRGVRFPNVEELYNGTVTATSVTVSDPNLLAERSNAIELSAERFWTRHALRATFFADDVHDAILRQSDATVTPSIVRTSNVDRVRTPGLELVWVGRDMPIRNVSIEANATFADSKVVRNSRDPLMDGKYWLRVPKTRGSVVVAYRPRPEWLGSIGYRHQGRAYNDPYNLDILPNVYGGVSSVNQIDARLSYKPMPIAEVAFGIDNLTDSRAWVSHPFPGRTLFLELRLGNR
jgi:iron complex outermembrane recepter protein